MINLYLWELVSSPGTRFSIGKYRSVLHISGFFLGSIPRTRYIENKPAINLNIDKLINCFNRKRKNQAK